MASIAATPEQLDQLLTPFVNARFNMQRDRRGYVIPRTIFADILANGVDHVDADIRSVDTDGVELFRSSQNIVIQLGWHEVRRIVIRGENGGLLVYRPAVALAIAA